MHTSCTHHQACTHHTSSSMHHHQACTSSAHIIKHAHILHTSSEGYQAREKNQLCLRTFAEILLGSSQLATLVRVSYLLLLVWNHLLLLLILLLMLLLVRYHLLIVHWYRNLMRCWPLYTTKTLLVPRCTEPVESRKSQEGMSISVHRSRVAETAWSLTLAMNGSMNGIKKIYFFLGSP